MLFLCVEPLVMIVIRTLIIKGRVYFYFPMAICTVYSGMKYKGLRNKVLHVYTRLNTEHSAGSDARILFAFQKYVHIQREKFRIDIETQHFFPFLPPDGGKGLVIRGQ